MNNDINGKIVHAAPVPPFVRFVASAVPMVFDNSLSYYEALCALWKWMQDNLVDVINNNASVTEQYIDYDLHTRELFIELQSYVDNYFDNLDVQEEINNKLDAMVEAGTLQEIITTYIQANVAWTFDTVADMKEATNFVVGSYAQTLGYYVLDDGGGAIYKIIAKETPTANGNINIDAEFDAQLITTEANPLQFGAYGDDTNDDTDALQNCIDYAEAHYLPLHIPNKTYLTDTITAENIKFINIEGTIHLSDSDQVLNIFENVNGATPNIFINKVTTGSIVMKGLNSASVEIQNAYTLDLVADNTENHNFIGYTNFKLGFIRNLILEDDGSGTKWINENYFEGGRFLSVTIGGGSSTYSHQSNVFNDPQCEHTTWTFTKAVGNKIHHARLEGNVTINFGADTFANVIETIHSETLQGYYFPQYEIPSNITVNDNSDGQNKVYHNKDLHVYKIASINKFNNPNNLTVDGEKVQPGKNQKIYCTGIIELPKDVTCFYADCDTAGYQFRIRCYDSTKSIMSSQPATSLIKNSPTIVYISNGNYGNSTVTRTNFWGITVPNNPEVKYIDVRVVTPNVDSANSFKFQNMNLYATSYTELDNYTLDGLKTSS